MLKELYLLSILTIFSPLLAEGQIKIRLFSSQAPETAIFAVTGGEYELKGYIGEPRIFRGNDLIVISKYDDRLAVKPMNSSGFSADSLILTARSVASAFSIRINGQKPVRQNYKGDFSCYPDMETLVLINKCDVESYIAGVVRSEGGINRHKEYFKTQAIIARTYMYGHLDKHLHDNYNVCDNTHCQAFNGITNDSVIISASLETHGTVILGRDSSLIISAFHSNCGGMTASSEDVWLTSKPYLRSVEDPYCLNSRNAVWVKKIGLDEWLGYLKRSGYTGSSSELSQLSFFQTRRWPDYKAGTFKIPFETIRKDLQLRSSFFSVVADRDSVTLKGKGYGHGVGLCQEGAMEMANKGRIYQQIINFYYFGVIITDISQCLQFSEKR